MQLEPYPLLRFCVFFIAGSLLGIGLVRLPLAYTDKKTLFCLLAGVAATSFLGKTMMRYLGAWLTLAGAGGLVWLISDRLEPRFGHSAYVQVGLRLSLVAGALYAL